MTLQVELVIPEGEVWSGPAELVIAKTMDGDIGVLSNHTPVLGILVEGSVVTIRPKAGEAETEAPDDASGAGDGEVVAAVGGGFFAVRDNRVSILAHQAQLGRQVDTVATRAALEKAQDAAAAAGGGEEPADVRYLRALLRAAGEPDDRA
jgi:F-type H+-transporting ATPase subunit epsilon